MDPEQKAPIAHSDTGSGVIHTQVPESIDPVFAKTSPKVKRSFSMTEYERFGAWACFHENAGL